MTPSFRASGATPESVWRTQTTEEDFVRGIGIVSVLLLGYRAAKTAATVAKLEQMFLTGQEQMKNFLERLNVCRKGMSVSAFSRHLGLNQKTLDLYVKGERKPSVELIVAVCSKCGCTADWLLGLESHPSSEQSDWHARAIVAEQKLARVNRALGHALKGFEELQEAVK
ncbi:MAG: helix-turn-helix transcriptional regulator [Kiritimatiellae bacterium]|nr:helix-turn-helix transcriptional regulator [Kiritimatiellia bacterium]